MPCARVTRKGLGAMVLFAAVMATCLPSSHCEALLDEVAHQPLRPLLELSQHLAGAADLVPFQTVKEGDTHHGRCKEQRPRQGKALHLWLSSQTRGVTSAIPSEEGPPW